jgi:hypothetical protein
MNCKNQKSVLLVSQKKLFSQNLGWYEKTKNEAKNKHVA